IAIDGPAVCKLDARDMAIAPDEAIDPRAQLEAYTLAAMVVLEELGKSCARCARQHARLALDHRDIRAKIFRTGRDLEPNIAAADHGQLATRPDRILQLIGIDGSAQKQDACKFGARHVEPPQF